jgi:acetyl-CoA carboxylase biotin carboxylase subunit
VRACRDLGVESVVVYAEPDQGSLATRLADRAVCIGPARAADSYLNQDAILTAAVALGVDAVHPGYGFLSENPTFAEACAAAGIAFVGPRPAALALMGNKMEARIAAARLGVPVIPGSDGAVGPDEARTIAKDVGLPVMLKAAAGGGGRGMRLVRDVDALEAFLASAGAEATASFGDGSIYVERYLDRARHIEIQVAYDEHGDGIHLGERDCTVQRRFQKLVEESPSPAIDPDTRKGMAEAALRLCRAAGYVGVGTVEFLYDTGDLSYHFIEMNTRLQVEHPVTELVTGVDLVTLQLRIAAGLPLGIRQEELVMRGHAIEFRVNAEDPNAGFTPGAGRLGTWSAPHGPGVRVDTHCEPGYLVPPYYDSLLAKLIVLGTDRDEALQRARRAIREFRVEGVRTTLPFHAWLVENEAFIGNETFTTWAEQAWTGRG